MQDRIMACQLGYSPIGHRFRSILLPEIRSQIDCLDAIYIDRTLSGRYVGCDLLYGLAESGVIAPNAAPPILGKDPS